MKLPSLALLCAILIASELSLAIFKRAGRTTGRDRSTLGLLWTVICLSMWLAFELRARFPSGRMPAPATLYLIGFVLFVVGLVIRWIAIIHLGRFFTVNVAIAQDHRLVTTGPYRFVRHPSYTGSLFLFVGLSLCLGNFYSAAAILVPVGLAFLRRIHVEETALRENFGDEYRAYATRTRRIIPLVW